MPLHDREDIRWPQKRPFVSALAPGASFPQTIRDLNLGILREVTMHEDPMGLILSIVHPKQWTAILTAYPADPADPNSRINLERLRDELKKQEGRRFQDIW